MRLPMLFTIQNNLITIVSLAASGTETKVEPRFMPHHELLSVVLQTNRLVEKNSG